MNIVKPFMTPALSILLAACTLVACSDEPGPSGSGGNGASSSSGSMGGAGGTGGAGGMGGAGGGPSALECQKAGGICMPQGACAQAGGTVPASSPAGCFFDDGPAECCVPPAPQPSPTTCAQAGGLCAPIGGCLDAGGYFTSTDAGCNAGASYVCCVPHAQCGEQTIDCCTDMTIYRPACDGGKLGCTLGMPFPKGTCKVP